MSEARVQGRHAGLSRDKVIASAVDLADRDGAAALSMRKVARELGVEAMTLYHYVPNKHALEDAIVEWVVADSLCRLEPALTWTDAVLAHARCLDEGLGVHPGAAPLLATRPAVTSRNLAAVEPLLVVLTDAGFEPRTALLVVHAVTGAVVSQHVGIALGAAEKTSSVPAELLAEVAMFSRAIEAGPITRSAQLEFTLAALIAGFEARLEQEKPGHSGV